MVSAPALQFFNDNVATRNRNLHQEKAVCPQHEWNQLFISFQPHFTYFMIFLLYFDISLLLFMEQTTVVGPRGWQTALMCGILDLHNQ